jgi:hypothetical protein
MKIRHIQVWRQRAGLEEAAMIVVTVNKGYVKAVIGMKKLG